MVTTIIILAVLSLLCLIWATVMTIIGVMVFVQKENQDEEIAKTNKEIEETYKILREILEIYKEDP